MSDELFEVPECKSPKLQWMEKHRVEVKRLGFDVGPDEEDEDGRRLFQYNASDDGWKHSYGGETEDDALAAWARARGKRLWNEEAS